LLTLLHYAAIVDVAVAVAVVSVAVAVAIVVTAVAPVFQTYIIGNICSALSSLDPVGVKFVQAMDSLNMYMTEQHFSKEDQLLFRQAMLNSKQYFKVGSSRERETSHSLTHSLTHSLNHSSAHSLTHSLAH
jgi:hypothetical protein